MTIATVVIAPQSVIETAVAWSARGLVADSLWISSDVLDEVDPDAPNAISVKVLQFDHAPVDDTLALQLAGLEALDEARVVWVRLSDDSSARTLGDLAVQLRELLPHDTTHWIDVVVPRRRTDEAFAPLAGEWVQFRVHPSDRSAPDVTDAGWDLGLAVPLHVTLALAGILGGTTTDLPWARLSAARYHIVRVFSRLVDGGLEARRASREFLGSVLPVTHAALQHGSRYLAADPKTADEIVSQTEGWLTTQEASGLRYEPPAQGELAPAPRGVSRWRHVVGFARFLPTGTMVLLGLRPEPDAQVGNTLEFDDLGYHIGPEVRVVKRTSGIPDFAALEARAASEAANELARARGREGGRPPIGVWERLARVSAALVDGGTGFPAGWDTAIVTSHGRQLSLAPESVFLGAPESVASPVPELARARNNAVASAALSEARRAVRDPVRAYADTSRVVATAARLAGEANALNRTDLSAQLADLGSLRTQARRASLLERVHGVVLGGLIRSRLDAERWARFAVAGPPGEAPTWGRAGVRLSRVLWIIIGVLVAVAICWTIWHEDIDSALNTTIGLGLGLAIVATVLIASVLVVLYLLFRSWRAFMEQGRRRLELMALWLDQAVKAQGSHAELENTERVAGFWVDLLSEIPEQGVLDQSEVVGVEAELAPMSFRIGHPRFQQSQLEQWLADAGAQPGWRLSCVQSVIGDFAGVPPERALAWLSEDQGLPSGRLDALLRQLSELQASWRDAVLPQVASKVMSHMIENADSLDVVRHPKLPLQQTDVRTFFGELTPSDDDLDDWPDDAGHSWVIASGSGSVDPQLVGTAVLCAGRIRIQVSDVEPHDEFDDDTAGDSAASRGAETAFR